MWVGIVQSTGGLNRTKWWRKGKLFSLLKLGHPSSSALEHQSVTKAQVWLLAAQNANKQAKLVEMKVCFISSAGNSVGRGRANIHLKAGSAGGTACRNSTVICNSHLPIGHQLSDQCHLRFRYSQSSVPGSICSHFLWPVLRIVAAHVLGIV